MAFDKAKNLLQQEVEQVLNKGNNPQRRVNCISIVYSLLCFFEIIFIKNYNCCNNEIKM